MRVKTDATRQRIIAAATKVFHEYGYSGASMAMVSAGLGGSKQTLYRYFPSKEELFLAVMFEAAIDHAAPVFEVLRPSDDLRLTLERFGIGYLNLALTPEALATRRMSITEGPRAGIGKLLFDRGPKVVWSRVATFMEDEMKARRLRAADPWKVAMHFRGLLESDTVDRVLVGAADRIGPTAIRLAAKDAADVLLRAYEAAAVA